MNEIKYSIQTGMLPVGVTLDTDTGRLVGEPAFDNVSLGPVWDTGAPAAKSSLGSYNEGDVVNFTTITASPRGSEQTLKSYTVLNAGDGLPWGLQLNPITGAIQGTVAQVKSEQAASLDSKNVDSPVWTTAFGRLAEVNEGSPLSLSVAATGQKSKTISFYNVVSGAMPYGFVLNPTTGAITGTAAELVVPDPISLPSNHGNPTWVTASALPEPNKTTRAFSQTLQATPATGNTIVNWQVVAGTTPAGITLHPTTGVLSGTAGEVVFEPYVDMPVANVPTWTTPAGSLTQQDELTTFTKTVSATGATGRTIVSYNIASGTVPYGLTLNPLTGVISGTLAEITIPEDYSVPVIQNPPSWTTLDGTLFVAREYDTLTLNLVAAPATGKSIFQYNLVTGMLPPGITLNPTTGQLSGSFADLLVIEAADVTPGTDPVINNSATVNGTTITPVNGALGSFNAGSALTIVLSSTVTSGRSFTALSLVGTDAVLPKGLLLNPLTSTISGTISSQAVKGTYNLTFRVVDSAGASSTKTFSLTIQ